MTIRAIVLDFDGVVVESNNIKHQAFSELFKEYPEHYEQMMRYHRAHDHTSRHDKFKYIVENVLKQEYTQQHADRMATRFAELTRDKIIRCPFVDGADDFIQHFFSDKYPLYIASATPLDELKVILKTRGLLRYFKGVYGAPLSKKQMLSNVIRKEKILPKEVLFIGDSFDDYKVAKDAGVSFIARISDYNFKEVEVTSFKTMSEIKSYLLKEMM
jgi:HAD superfamily hydrolase (TIGR01549 family)